MQKENKKISEKVSKVDFLQIYNTDYEKIRLGSENDGGYVLADGLKYDALISCGLSDNIDFENDFLRKYPNVDAYLFDGTIENIPPIVRECVWEKKNISQHKNQKEENLHELIKNYKNIFIKMDIEASEFSWLESISKDMMSNISQFVIEIHYLFNEFYFFDGRESPGVEKKIEIFKSLLKTHKLIHLSPNNCCDFSTIDGVVIPNVFECTFIRKDLCENSTPNTEKIPGRLDRKNHSNREDITLNHYPFVYNKPNKTIVVIDCYISNSDVEKKLIDQIKRIKEIGIDILLISNTIIKNDIISLVDYYIYDRRNQLFEAEYQNIKPILFTETVFNGDVPFIQTEIFTNGLQRHGLSVLVNLHNSVNFIKSLGYKNFIRLEVDDLFGSESLDFINKSTFLLKKENKKALLYYNHYNSEPSNISFHFMNFDVDYFLEKIPQIKNENDYQEYLLKNYGNLNFEIAEQFIYNNLKRNGDNDVYIKDGGDMSVNFPDTVWNTTTSTSNISSKFENCITTLFQVYNSNEIILFAFNKSNETKNRKIKVILKNEELLLNYNLEGFNTWSYNLFNKDELIEICVYEEERLLFVEKNENINNKIKFL
jgi:hypothetical protein